LKKCEPELNKLKESLAHDFKEGKIKADDYGLAKKKIDGHLANIDRAKAKDIRDIFPLHYTVLLAALPGVGKFEYCVSLAKHWLEKGENVVFIATEKSPDRIKEKMGALGLDIEKYEGKKFVFIDIYSHSTKEKYEKGLYVDNPANLNLISVNLDKAAEMVGKPAKIIFDSLSTLFLHAPDAEIKKFFRTLNSRARAEYGLIIYTMEEEMHEPRTVIALKHLVDCVMEMRFDEEDRLKRQFRIAYAKDIIYPPDWFEYKIVPPR
ncbi:MAG: ATPase domain-containing protein, partial [Candidatus Hydrothermarchaeaceae archaeon]